MTAEYNFQFGKPNISVYDSNIQRRHFYAFYASFNHIMRIFPCNVLSVLVYSRLLSANILQPDPNTLLFVVECANVQLDCVSRSNSN